MTAPTVYNFHPGDFKYVGASEADLDPEGTRIAGEPRYITPGLSTLVAPPAEQEGFARCFIGGRWVQVEDHTGETVYEKATKREREVTELGPLPEDVTHIQPGEHDHWGDGAWVEDTEAKTLELRQHVTNERDRRLAAGYVDAVTGKTWQCDEASQGKWTAVGSSAMPWALGLVTANEPSFPLISADNTSVTLSSYEAYSLFQGRVMPWVTAMMFAARALKDLDPIPDDFTNDKYWPGG